MPDNAKQGLALYAKTAPHLDMRFFAAEAHARGMTLRALAKAVGRDHGSVVRTLNALDPTPTTINLFARALKLDDRRNRVRRGAHAMTERDLAHFQRLLIRAIVVSDEYEDFDDATMRISKALEDCKAETFREVLYSFAAGEDHGASVARLCKLVGITPPRKRSRLGQDDTGFWEYDRILSRFGLPLERRKLFLDALRFELGVDSDIVRCNDAYFKNSVFGASTGHGGEHLDARAREILSQITNEERTENESAP